MQRAQLIRVAGSLATVAAWAVVPTNAFACEAGGGGGTGPMKAGEACCAPDGKSADASHGKGDACCAPASHGAACTCDKHEEKGHEHGGAGHGHGAMGHGHAPMGHDHAAMGHGPMNGRNRMRAMLMAHKSRLMTLRYMPSALSAAGPNGNQYVVLSGGKQFGGNGIFGMGFEQNLAVQLFNQNPAAGSWVAPYCGVVPHVGVDIGKARLEAGVLGGFGVMARTISDTALNASVLDARLQWVVEPRVELGMKRGNRGLALFGSYLFTPNSQELGGFSVGLKATFGGGHSGEGHGDGHEPMRSK